MKKNCTNIKPILIFVILCFNMLLVISTNIKYTNKFNKKAYTPETITKEHLKNMKKFKENLFILNLNKAIFESSRTIFEIFSKLIQGFVEGIFNTGLGSLSSKLSDYFDEKESNKLITKKSIIIYYQGKEKILKCSHYKLIKYSRNQFEYLIKKEINKDNNELNVSLNSDISDNSLNDVENSDLSKKFCKYFENAKLYDEYYKIEEKLKNLFNQKQILIEKITKSKIRLFLNIKLRYLEGQIQKNKRSIKDIIKKIHKSKFIHSKYKFYKTIKDKYNLETCCKKKLKFFNKLKLLKKIKLKVIIKSIFFYFKTKYLCAELAKSLQFVSIDAVANMLYYYLHGKTYFSTGMLYMISAKISYNIFMLFKNIFVLIFSNKNKDKKLVNFIDIFYRIGLITGFVIHLKYMLMY